MVARIKGLFSKNKEDENVNESFSSSNYEYNIFMECAKKYYIPEVQTLSEENYTHLFKQEIFLRNKEFHLDFMKAMFPNLKVYKTIEELEAAGLSIATHLKQKEENKEKLNEKQMILLKTNSGKQILGIFLPNINIDIDFDKVILIGSSVFNYFYGKGKDLDFVKNHNKITLEDLLQYAETNNINDIGIDPINEHQYKIMVEVGKKNVRLTNIPIVKEIVQELFNRAMIEMNKDHTTDVPTTTGLLKKDLINKDGVHITRTFRFNFIKIKSGLTLSIRRFMNLDEINNMGLTGLGYSKDSINMINEMISDKNGVSVVVGETNSGKSTLLTCILNEIDKTDARIISIENPTEMITDYLQIDLSDTETADEKHKMTKEIAQKGALRHNPNVLLISEIRTKDEIKFFTDLGLKGHMAFSTFHAGSIQNAIDILLKSTDEDELKSILNLFVHQELLAKKCSSCNGSGELEKGVCPSCNGVGSKGVIPIYEMIKFNNLKKNDSLKDLEDLYRRGKITYLSKTTVAKDLYEKDLIHKEEYDRVVKNNINLEEQQ